MQNPWLQIYAGWRGRSSKQLNQTKKRESGRKPEKPLEISSKLGEKKGGGAKDTYTKALEGKKEKGGR